MLYLRALGDLSRAVAACRTAVELDPGSVEARATLADMLTKALVLRYAVRAGGS